MIGRATLMVVALAAGTAGGALLGGCGGGTKTVTVSGAAAPTSSAGGQSATHTSTSTASTTGAPAGQSTTGGATPGATAQGTSTTRTAPAPAFTKTGTQSAEAAANTQAEAAAVIVTAHGYTPTDITDYHPNQTLRVLIGTRTGSADGYAQRAFFFLDNHYLGTDTSEPSASIHVVSQSDTEVTLAYALYRAHDSLCCPSGGQATVHFQLNDGQLVPLEQIPPVNSATGLARQ
jgi:hypothetical protein